MKVSLEIWYALAFFTFIKLWKFKCFVDAVWYHHCRCCWCCYWRAPLQNLISSLEVAARVWVWVRMCVWVWACLCVHVYFSKYISIILLLSKAAAISDDIHTYVHLYMHAICVYILMLIEFIDWFLNESWRIQCEKNLFLILAQTNLLFYLFFDLNQNFKLLGNLWNSLELLRKILGALS